MPVILWLLHLFYSFILLRIYFPQQFKVIVIIKATRTVIIEIAEFNSAKFKFS